MECTFLVPFSIEYMSKKDFQLSHSVSHDAQTFLEEGLYVHSEGLRRDGTVNWAQIEASKWIRCARTRLEQQKKTKKKRDILGFRNKCVEANSFNNVRQENTHKAKPRLVV